MLLYHTNVDMGDFLRFRKDRSSSLNTSNISFYARSFLLSLRKYGRITRCFIWYLYIFSHCFLVFTILLVFFNTRCHNFICFFSVIILFVSHVSVLSQNFRFYKILKSLNTNIKFRAKFFKGSPNNSAFPCRAFTGWHFIFSIQFFIVQLFFYGNAFNHNCNSKSATHLLILKKSSFIWVKGWGFKKEMK